MSFAQTKQPIRSLEIQRNQGENSYWSEPRWIFNKRIKNWTHKREIFTITNEVKSLPTSLYTRNLRVIQFRQSIFEGREQLWNIDGTTKLNKHKLNLR